MSGLVKALLKVNRVRQVAVEQSANSPITAASPLLYIHVVVWLPDKPVRETEQGRKHVPAFVAVEAA